MFVVGANRQCRSGPHIAFDVFELRERGLLEIAALENVPPHLSTADAALAAPAPIGWGAAPGRISST